MGTTKQSVRAASNAARGSECTPKGRSRRKRLSVLAAVLVGGFGAALCLGTIARADDGPAHQAVVAAEKTGDLMVATLFAALGQEFAETTANNVEQGKKSISLI